MTKETSKAIARKASWIMSAGRMQMQGILALLEDSGADQDTIAELEIYKDQAESVAASALAQREKGE